MKQDNEVLISFFFTLGDDLSRINRTNILKGLKNLQNPDGSFIASKEEQDCDMRFVYCAASICTLIDSFEGINTEKMVDYILKSQSYEGQIIFKTFFQTRLGHPRLFESKFSLPWMTSLARLTNFQQKLLILKPFFKSEIVFYLDSF